MFGKILRNAVVECHLSYVWKLF